MKRKVSMSAEDSESKTYKLENHEIPDELFELIFSFAPNKTLLNLSLTCSHFNTIIHTSMMIWKARYEDARRMSIKQYYTSTYHNLEYRWNSSEDKHEDYKSQTLAKIKTNPVKNIEELITKRNNARAHSFSKYGLPTLTTFEFYKQQSKALHMLMSRPETHTERFSSTSKLEEMLEDEDGPHIWLWDSGRSGFKPYDKDVSDAIEEAMQEGVEEYKISNTHKIVFETMRQVSLQDSTKTRKVQRKADKSNIKKLSTLGLLFGGDEDFDGDMGDVGNIIQWFVDHPEINDAMNLKLFYLCDFGQDQIEISWINLANIAPLINALPNLQFFTSKGMNGLSITPPVRHENLLSFTLVTGGLSENVIRQVMELELPNLLRLELWLGTDDYGGDWSEDDFTPTLLNENETGIFPNLEYLGLRNADNTDRICAATIKSAVARRVRIIDLSQGNITDQGALRLLQDLVTDFSGTHVKGKKYTKSKDFEHLEVLDLNHNNLSDDAVDTLLNIADLYVDVNGRNEDYIAVSE